MFENAQNYLEKWDFLCETKRYEEAWWAVKSTFIGRTWQTQSLSLIQTIEFWKEEAVEAKSQFSTNGNRESFR